MSHTPYSRNRQRIGGAVLTYAEVALIKRRLLNGIEAPRDIGNAYGVSTETIRRISANPVGVADVPWSLNSI